MATSGTVRVRFAPSPTGNLHTGGARTALFNWLIARQSGGKFILRIEDTDEERSTEESTRAILDGLTWLGLHWDEGPDPHPGRFGESLGAHGPYFQSGRVVRHQELVQRLLDHERAFYCPATAEEMMGPDGKKMLFSPYHDLPPHEQHEHLEKAGGKLPVRFKCPKDQAIQWEDTIRGPVKFNSDEIGDFIIQKSNGQVLYNCAVVCDDADMQITHVLRGEDHISNTPKQLLLYDALGFSPPVFGHAPLILGMDRARLSKRHGATSVDGYRGMGVLPGALLNFLALIGWAPKDNREMFTLEELIEAFNPADIGKSAGAFNIEKLAHFNGLHIRALAPDEFFERLKPYLPAGWLEHLGEAAARSGRQEPYLYAKAALTLYQDKLTMLAQVEEQAWYFFRAPGPDDYSEQAVEKFLTGNDKAPGVLSVLYERFDAIPAGQWDVERLAPLIEAYCEETGLGKGKVMQPWRVALTGDKVSPGFFDLLSVLGKEAVLSRAKPWVERLSGL